MLLIHLDVVKDGLHDAGSCLYEGSPDRQKIEGKNAPFSVLRARLALIELHQLKKENGRDD